MAPGEKECYHEDILVSFQLPDSSSNAVGVSQYSKRERQRSAVPLCLPDPQKIHGNGSPHLKASRILPCSLKLATSAECSRLVTKL